MRSPFVGLQQRFTLTSALGLGILFAAIFSTEALAQPAPTQLEGGIQRQVLNPPPEALIDLLNQQIEAANQRDLAGVMATYSPEFRHRDGLDREGLERAIQTLWDNHPDLTYSAQIESWRQVGPDIIADVSSQLQGSQASVRGSFQVKASTLVRNRYRPDPTNPEQLLLIDQEVLREASTLTSGSAPPTVTLSLPDVVKPGSTYSLQAIVTEPLTRSLLLGAVTEQPITSSGYPAVTSFPLEPLQAGGIFRQADAPKEPGAEWISVMLVNQTGITLESRRLTISDRLVLEGSLATPASP
ncbi:MAG: nuclear transport factor 2 family protein [Thermostichus sp. DG02_5_bins_236]